MEYKDYKFPPDIVMKGETYLVLQKAYTDFLKQFGDKYVLENYKYLMSITEYKENGGYWVVSIMPEMGETIEEQWFGTPFDEKTREYPKGGAMTFYYAKSDLTLLKKHFMR